MIQIQKKEKTPATTYEILKETNAQLSYRLKVNKSINANLQLIKKLRDEGKSVEPFRMKNNQIGYIIQSPLNRYFAKEDIDMDMFAAGLEYQKDYTACHQDPLSSKVIIDGTSITQKSTKRREKFVSNRHINASTRIKEIKRLLSILSPKDYNYETLISLILEQELSLRKIEQLTASHRKTIKKNVRNALGIIRDFYYKEKFI